MGAAKRMKTNPRELAQKILDNLDLDGIADKLEIAGPGLLISPCNDFLASLGNCKSTQRTRDPQTVVVDYSSPNLAKEMHVAICAPPLLATAGARAGISGP